MIGGRSGRDGHLGSEERECRGELLARERRGELSKADRIALDAHLESCVSCRLSRAIQSDFEADCAVEVDDADRIARMSAAARRWGQRRVRPRGRSWLRYPQRRTGGVRALVLVLGLLMAAGTASATAWWWRSAAARQPEARPEPRATPPVSMRPRALPPARPRAVEPTREVEPEAKPEEGPGATEPASVSPIVMRRVPRPHATAPALRGARDSATSLLRLAGEARGRGETELASSLYRRLQREFPSTREAALSSVPWGGILLREGQPDRALDQFDRYLATEPRGNLLPEALYGRGRALAAAGRSDDERKTWRRLLVESPGSAYESHARRRLDELK